MKLKSLALPIFKLAIAGILIYWLISSGKLDVKQLSVFFTDWRVLTAAILHFAFVGVTLGALRWRIILKGLKIDIPIKRITNFQLVGLFFNVAMPGAVGGDLVKAVYVIKDQGNKNRTHVMMSILIDRISGMTGLFTIGVVAILANFNTLWSKHLIQPTLMLVLLMFLGMVFLHLLAIRKTNDERDLILKVLNKSVPGFSLLKKIYMSFREFRNDPLVLVKALFYSITIQLLTLFYFMVITIVLIPDFADWAGLTSIFPIGIFTVAIPISPGGLGVGHLAFERLYDLLGYKGGANVFNVYVLGYMALCTLGAIPYLLAKKRVDISEIEKFETTDSQGVKL